MRIAEDAQWSEVRNLEMQKKRLLVIEDDEEMRSLLSDFLQEERWEIDSAGDASEAFHKLVREAFDLIITDLRMPGLSGLDIIPRIKKLRPEASIVAITAFGSEDIHRRVLERGAALYLEKPLVFQELRRCIEKLIFSKTQT